MPRADTRRLSLRQRWLAIAAATVALQFSFWPSVAAVAAAIAEDAQGATGLALGLALVPLVFMVLAFMSRAHRGAGPVLQAMGLFILVGLPIGLFSPVLGLYVGYAAGAVRALAPSDPPKQTWRWTAVAIGALYLTVLMVFLPGLGVMTAAVAPFVVLGLVDQLVELRADAAAPAAGQSHPRRRNAL